jgi:protease I
MDLKGKRIAILVDNIYQEMEVWYPLYRFREAGAEVVIVGARAGETYTSKLGYPVVPGGFAPDFIRRYSKAKQFVKDLDAQGKLVAAICHGLWVLCSAGILRGRRATCFFAIQDDVINAGGLYEDAEVVVDRNLVTSRKPDDLPAFCREALRVVGSGAATSTTL